MDSRDFSIAVPATEPRLLPKRRIVVPRTREAMTMIVFMIVFIVVFVIDCSCWKEQKESFYR